MTCCSLDNEERGYEVEKKTSNWFCFLLFVFKLPWTNNLVTDGQNSELLAVWIRSDKHSGLFGIQTVGNHMKTGFFRKVPLFGSFWCAESTARRVLGVFGDFTIDTRQSRGVQRTSIVFIILFKIEKGSDMFFHNPKLLNNPLYSYPPLIFFVQRCAI